MKTTALVLSMALFVVLGGPLVWVVWEAVNELLTGHPGNIQWALTLPALALLVVLLALLGRTAPKLDRTTND